MIVYMDERERERRLALSSVAAKAAAAFSLGRRLSPVYTLRAAARKSRSLPRSISPRPEKPDGQLCVYAFGSLGSAHTSRDCAPWPPPLRRYAAGLCEVCFLKAAKNPL